MISEQDKEAILRQEDFVSEILRRRSPDKAKDWWERAGIVSAATAVLTVIVTSVAGYYAQKSLRERENSFTEMQARTQLAREAATQANSSIASMLKINEERLKFSRGELDSLSDSAKTALVRNTNRLQQDWRVTREDAEMALYLAFDSSSDVSPAWQRTRQAIEIETSCLEKAYMEHENQRRVSSCETEIAARKAAVADLRRRMKRGYDQARRL